MKASVHHTMPCFKTALMTTSLSLRPHFRPMTEMGNRDGSGRVGSGQNEWTRGQL